MSYLQNCSIIIIDVTCVCAAACCSLFALFPRSSVTRRRFSANTFATFCSKPLRAGRRSSPWDRILRAVRARNRPGTAAATVPTTTTTTARATTTPLPFRLRPRSKRRRRNTASRPRTTSTRSGGRSASNSRAATVSGKKNYATLSLDGYICRQTCAKCPYDGN